MALNVELRPASAPDLDAVTALVRAAGLPAEGLADQFPDAYVVSSHSGSLIGVAGLEVHGPFGLLRSVAVQPGFRGAGVGRELVSNRTELARSLGLRRVFLLTTTAVSYFEGLGFLRAARSDAPEPVARSSEFASICPTSAICLFQDP